MSRWVATCRLCHQEVLRASRIGDAELAELRTHTDQHSSVRLPGSAGVEATLKSFAVAPEVTA
jgi:hypothetical protein